MDCDLNFDYNYTVFYLLLSVVLLTLMIIFKSGLILCLFVFLLYILTTLLIIKYVTNNLICNKIR